MEETVNTQVTKLTDQKLYNDSMPISCRGSETNTSYKDNNPKFYKANKLKICGIVAFEFMSRQWSLESTKVDHKVDGSNKS